MARKLIVTNAFADYLVGGEITEADAMAEAEANHPQNVVPVEWSDEVAPSADALKPRKS